MISAINDTVEYVKLLAQNLAGCEPNYAVLAIMLDLKIPVNYDGFEYLKAAIVMQYEEPTRDLLNDIYKALAEHYGISADVIASAIRGAIKTAWSRTEPEKWSRYLPAVPIGKKGAPTNAEIITGLARIVELWQGCSEAYIRQRRGEVVSCGKK